MPAACFVSQIAPSLRVAAMTVVCCVTLLDHIDIWPSSDALHTVRPDHNASRARNRDRSSPSSFSWDWPSTGEPAHSSGHPATRPLFGLPRLTADAW